MSPCQTVWCMKTVLSFQKSMLIPPCNSPGETETLKQEFQSEDLL